MEDVAKMREVCQLAAQTLKFIAPHVKPGVSTNELDKLVHEYTLDHGARPAPWVITASLKVSAPQ